MAIRIIPLILAIFLAGSMGVVADDSIPTPKNADEVAIAKLRLDLQQAEFNQKLEGEKLDVERLKAWITGGTLMIPLLVAALSFAFGVWNQSQQARMQRESQTKTEKNAFELKAAEIVFADSGPHSTFNRARALKAIFPSRLPDDFVTSFDPKSFVSAGGESAEQKIKFFQSVAPHISDVHELAALWQQLFPGDKWPPRVRNNLPRPPDASNAPSPQSTEPNSGVP